MSLIDLNALNWARFHSSSFFPINFQFIFLTSIMMQIGKTNHITRLKNLMHESS